MNGLVKTLPAYRIAYMRRVGAYGPGNVEVMEKLKQWARGMNLLDDATLFAVPRDNPETTPPEKCRFDACIVIPGDYQVDEAVSVGELPGGEYLVYEVKHTEEDIQKAYASLHSSGYQLDNRPIMEKYSGDLAFCEICFPVMPHM